MKNTKDFYLCVLPLACQFVCQYQKVNRVTDHFDFAGLDSQSGPTLNGEELFTRSLHKVANIQDVEKTK